ncbi:RNA-directed DNA polymerase, eukaryota, reverse transcriptase zinc-binding domain protein [Tanacetum coccineum]|uniref:RNA-directed DNA polymerase, eukaryota, reverse transcriptase zinc-binding domain protein n=1 Tax=Tanacetum coccineum TaxID=301880 RepID=A0ABQ5I026_9ASTR
MIEWNKDVKGCSMFKVVKKCSMIKKPKISNIISWEKENVHDRVDVLRSKVKVVQTYLDKNPFDDTIKKQSCEVLREYTEAARDEENLMIQKAKIDWLKGGDRNTDFFHMIIKGRIHKGRVMSICDENEMRYENEKVAEQFEKHFKKFLGTKDEVCAFPTGCIVVNNKLNFDEAMRMVRPVNDEEIRDAMFGINDSKAPGPDGFTAKFFKATWKIIGKDICMAVRDFFLIGKLLGEVNATLISLVPKIPTPSKVSDFRPIVCCNVLYKCISKIMTNRIKEALGKIVNENQSAFIAGRQITDNILLDFIKVTLEQFGFHERTISWIMKCVTTTKFSININGERVGYFNGGRGLRQGDPISPYLFTMTMEMFTLLMKKNIDCKSIGVIKKTLEEFSKYSGLKPNMQKSTMFFGGLSVPKQENLFQIIPFSIGRLPIRYLGVPLVTKQISVKDCKPLIEKVKVRVQDWRNRSLSYAGRLQLIASILSSMQIYWASVFLLPRTIIKEINKLLKGFLWCQGELIKGRAKISWENICKQKDQGGLGLKDLQKWNEVLIMKHLWNVAAKKDTLWVKWVHVEKLKGRRKWEVDCDSNSSSVWRNLLDMRDKMKQHVYFKIGNGQCVSALV